MSGRTSKGRRQTTFDIGCGGLSASECPCFVGISVHLWASANDNKGQHKFVSIRNYTLRVRRIRRSVGQRNWALGGSLITDRTNCQPATTARGAIVELAFHHSVSPRPVPPWAAPPSRSTVRDPSMRWQRVLNVTVTLRLNYRVFSGVLVVRNSCRLLLRN